MPLTLRLIAGDTWQVYAICDSNGNTFLDDLGLGAKQEAKVAAVLQRCAQGGPTSIPTERNHLVDPESRLYQLRINDCRILWFYDAGRVVVCCHAYVKKSNKAPPGEIARGRAAAMQYREAKVRGEILFLRDEE